jgi:hypothetical protein
MVLRLLGPSGNSSHWSAEPMAVLFCAACGREWRVLCRLVLLPDGRSQKEWGPSLRHRPTTLAR